VLSNEGPAGKLTVRIPPQLSDALTAMAEAEGVSQSELMRRAVRLMVDPAYFAATVALQLADIGIEPTEPDEHRAAA
jgi:Arc/MetJ-type ribon-helix-helix transcriptional regulator